MCPSQLDARAFTAALLRPEVLRNVPGWLERLGIPARDRDDVAAEVFLCAWRSWHTFDPTRGRPERWLNRIAVHVCAHYHERASHRREVFLDNLPQVPDPRPDASSLIDEEQSRIGVLDALQWLALPERAVLIDHDIDGVPMADVAAGRAMPLSTCYKWRARALDALRAEFKRREVVRRQHAQLRVTSYHCATASLRDRVGRDRGARGARRRDRPRRRLPG